jgi:hypothetical protein
MLKASHPVCLAQRHWRIGNSWAYLQIRYKVSAATTREGNKRHLFLFSITRRMPPISYGLTDSIVISLQQQNPLTL